MADWAPGDLALCVKRDGGGRQQLRWIEPGRVEIVAQVITHPTWPALGLSFESTPCWLSFYDSRCFTKIHPLTDEEAAEFVADLKRGKPVPVEA